MQQFGEPHQRPFGPFNLPANARDPDRLFQVNTEMFPTAGSSQAPFRQQTNTIPNQAFNYNVQEQTNQSQNIAAYAASLSAGMEFDGDPWRAAMSWSCEPSNQGQGSFQQ